MPGLNTQEESQPTIEPVYPLNTPLKSIEIWLKDVTKNAATVQKWKPNPLPTAQ